MFRQLPYHLTCHVHFYHSSYLHFYFLYVLVDYDVCPRLCLACFFLCAVLYLHCCVFLIVVALSHEVVLLYLTIFIISCGFCYIFMRICLYDWLSCSGYCFLMWQRGRTGPKIYSCRTTGGAFKGYFMINVCVMSTGGVSFPCLIVVRGS